MGEPLGQILLMYLGFVTLSIIIYRWLKKFIIRKIAVVIIVSLILSPILLYVPIEINTMMYGKQFKNISIETGFNLPIIYYKVFKIRDNEAKLFIVEGENGVHEIGNYYWFVKEQEQWKFTKKWKTVWTNLGGSASDFTVPPYF